MAVHKSRRPAGSGGSAADDPFHDVEVREAVVVGSAFTVDTAIASLAVEGIPVVRSSPLETAGRLGTLNAQGEHKLVFRASDADAVAEALRTADLI